MSRRSRPRAPRRIRFSVPLARITRDAFWGEISSARRAIAEGESLDAKASPEGQRETGRIPTSLRLVAIRRRHLRDVRDRFLISLTLLLGGARSGKSAMAVRLGLESGLPVTFIATASAGDSEMAERIRMHRANRPPEWTTLEAPLDVVDAIAGAAADDFVILDCLTLWVSNLLEVGRTADEIAGLADQMVNELQERRAVVVSNEVGMGIVPTNELARVYRDVLGAVNAQFAKYSDRALLIVAGMAIDLHRV